MDKPDFAEPVDISDVPDPPDWLNEYAISEWNTITPELAKSGVLAIIDFSAVALYCDAYGTFRSAKKRLDDNGEVFETEKGYQMPSPYVAIANKNFDAAVKLLKEFGLTPASRRKMSGVQEPKGEDEFTRWQRRKAKNDAKSKKAQKG